MRRRYRGITIAFLLMAVLWVGFQTMGISHHHSASEEQALSFCGFCQVTQSQSGAAEQSPPHAPALSLLEEGLSVVETLASSTQDLGLPSARAPPLT